MTRRQEGNVSYQEPFRTLLAVLIAACGILSSESAEGTIVPTESFAYSTGDLTGQGGWSGSSNWDVESGNLTYPASCSLVASGNRATINGGGGSVNRSLGATLDFDSQNTYYVSFLVRKDAIPETSSEYLWLSLRDSSSYKATMGIGSSENVLLGSNTGGGFNVSTSTIAGSTDYLYVAKMVTASSGDEHYFATVYGPSETVPATETTSWDVTFSSAITGTANSLRLETGSNGYYTVDQIRIGTSWANVTVPEPNTLIMLLGLAGIGLIGCSRRCRRS